MKSSTTYFSVCGVNRECEREFSLSFVTFYFLFLFFALSHCVFLVEQVYIYIQFWLWFLMWLFFLQPTANFFFHFSFFVFIRTWLVIIKQSFWLFFITSKFNCDSNFKFSTCVQKKKKQDIVLHCFHCGRVLCAGFYSFTYIQKHTLLAVYIYNIEFIQISG